MRVAGTRHAHGASAAARQRGAAKAYSLLILLSTVSPCIVCFVHLINRLAALQHASDRTPEASPAQDSPLSTSTHPEIAEHISGLCQRQHSSRPSHKRDRGSALWTTRTRKRAQGLSPTARWSMMMMTSIWRWAHLQLRAAAPAPAVREQLAAGAVCGIALPYPGICMCMRPGLLLSCRAMMYAESVAANFCARLATASFASLPPEKPRCCRSAL